MKNSFTETLDWAWQSAERILGVVFLATFSLNIRKVFLTPHSFLNGEFNEYMTFSFSWADLLMCFTIIIFTIKYIISQYNTRLSSKNISEYNNSFLSIKNTFLPITSRETFFLLLFVFWALLSVSWSLYKPIAIYRFLVLFEIIAFFAILSINIRSIKWLRLAFFALMANAVLQSFIGILQFVSNGSLGLSFMGESIVSPILPGVAKIIIEGERHIRAYGTFPHPNIMAGFLVIPLVLLFSVLINRTEKGVAGSNSVSHETEFRMFSMAELWIMFILILIGFMLTFSRSAFLGLFVAMVLVLWKKFHHKIPYLRYLIAGLLLIGLLVSGKVVSQNHSSFIFSSQSLSERKQYTEVSREIISTHPVAGAGFGQFVYTYHQTQQSLLGWQYQPAHNVFLLITSELGIIGLMLFLLFITSFLLRISERKEKRITLTKSVLRFIIISFLVVSIFDHYLWDLKQGLIIFAIPFALLNVYRWHMRHVSAD